jgi:pimeloyl-ACP methyl ester carboxylesterase
MDYFARDGFVFDVSDRAPKSGDGGDGELIVLLHGFPQNRHVWDRVTPSLNEAGYRTLAPDQRGYSPRARPARRRDYVQSELVADVIALIDAAGHDQVHLVGHDWGAFVAWAVASRHPDRLRSLTAVSVPHPQAFAWAMPRGQLVKSWYMLAFQLPAAPEAFLPSRRGVELLRGGGLTGEQVHSYVDPLGRAGLHAALNWYRALPFSHREKGAKDFARPSTIATTFVWSDRDAVISRRAAEATGRFVTGPYRFEVLGGRSHWLPDEAPQQLADLILDRVRG